MKITRLLLLTLLLTGSWAIAKTQPETLAAENRQITSTGVNIEYKAADSLQVYVGTYEIAPGQRLTISLDGEKLYILPPGEAAKTELKRISKTEFEVVGETAHLLFTKNVAGQVWQVELKFGNGASATAKKL